MLTKIIQLNSSLCSKAIISLDRDSIQLVGSNTIGKTSLINSLNLLFIIDGNKMQFGGEHDFQQSIHHYFPTINHSYMIFEVMKNGYYCVLMKRDVQKNLEFYKIDSEFRDEHYYIHSNGQQKLFNFHELFTNFATLGITPQPLKHKQDLFNIVYERGKRGHAVVWLQDTVKTSGLSNNFSKIYSYLINPKLITNNTLKDALIIADNREGEEVNFAQGNKQDLYRLQDEIRKLRNIEEIQPDFELFVEKVKECDLKTERISKLYYAFNSKFNKEIIEIEKSVAETKRKIQEIETNIKYEVKPIANQIQQNIGSKNTSLINEKKQLEENQKLLKAINNHLSLEMLRQSKENLEKEARGISFKIDQIEHNNYTQKDLKQSISELRQKIASLKTQIENYDQLLIHHISDENEIKSLLNTILSKKVLELTKEKIRQKISNASKQFLEIYDGKIELPKDFKIDKFVSVDLFKRELDESEKHLKEKEGILKVVEDFEANQTRLNTINSQMKNVETQIQQIEQKPALENKIAGIKKSISNLEEEIGNLKAQSEKIEKEETKFSNQIQFHQQKILKYLQREMEVKGWNDHLKRETISPREYQTASSIDDIYKEMIDLNSDLKAFKPHKDRLFNDLKNKTLRNEASEHDFIEVIQDEIATIESKNKAIDDLLQSIAQSFSNPTFQLLDKFGHFKVFINNFNQQLSKIKISNIEKIVIKVKAAETLIKELELISKLQHFTKDNLFAEQLSDNLVILKIYLEQSRKVEFKEMFEIKAEVTINGITKEIDFSKQIESTGADKVIRLIIILSIIHKLAISHKENKIPICIDEVLTIDPNNTNQILQFCKENNFIPLFAAPYFITSAVIDRTYMLTKQKDGKAIPIIYAERN